MLIHLGKAELGQTYKVDVTSKGTTSVVYFERAHNPRDANCVIELPFKKTKESAGTVSHVEDNGAGDGFDVVGRTEGRGDRWNGATK